MWNLSRVAAATVCFFGVACAFAGGESNMKTDEYVIAIPSFDKVQPEEAGKAASTAIRAYDDAVANLIAQVRGAKTNDQETIAIYLLGELRAKAAVFDLVKIIDFQAEHVDPKTRVGRWGPYPAQQALAKIGCSSVPPLLKALGEEENELRRKLMLMVLLDCYGKDVSGFVLEKTAQSAPEKAKVRYEKAASIMRGWK